MASPRSHASQSGGKEKPEARRKFTTNKKALGRRLASCKADCQHPVYLLMFVPFIIHKKIIVRYLSWVLGDTDRKLSNGHDCIEDGALSLLSLFISSSLLKSNHKCSFPRFAVLGSIHAYQACLP